MDGFVVFFTIFYLALAAVVLGSIIVYVRSCKIRNKIRKQEYVIERTASQEILKREKDSMNALMNGDIKCHIIKNNAETYDVGNWVHELNSFMKKPIYKELLSLKGHDIDGKY